mmetsp:Transcript_24875/g.50555  ORF Transcript_24875/g.50555 Transcript_24875/m.50555 type:complete len:85 (-) Transcript_24875:130-384(-)
MPACSRTVLEILGKMLCPERRAELTQRNRTTTLGLSSFWSFTAMALEPGEENLVDGFAGSDGREATTATSLEQWQLSAAWKKPL